MIETALFFILGFLCAGFLALMVAPAIWRRAVALTRKRIEASVPLTMDEIQADKDRLRAEFAMSTRRLEMSIKEFREKAATQIVEINRNREELKRLTEDRNEKHRSITELEAKAAELRNELMQREEQLQNTRDRLTEADALVEERALELERLGGMYQEASLVSSSRQIELVARESEIDKLSDDVTELRNQRKEADKRVREIAGENKAIRETLREEKKKSGELEHKIERLLSNVSDQEEKLERREKDLARLREQLKEAATSLNDLEQQLVGEQRQRVKLEAELADTTARLSSLLAGARGGDVEKAMAKLTRDRQRMEERMTALLRENKKLRAESVEQQRVSSEDWMEERRENAVLREQINDLAAEVVGLTATLDGPESPIRHILSQDDADSQRQRQEAPGSLADRVRALQKAASAKAS